MKTTTRKTTIFASGAALLASLLTPLSATLVIEYDADSAGTAPNPTTVGWGVSAAGPGITSVAGSEMGLNYWQLATDNSSRAEYISPSFSAGTLTDMSTNGWTATTVQRVQDASTGISANYIAVWDGTHRWAVDLKQNAGFEGAKYWNAAGGLVIVENFDTQTDYFTFQMYYDPSLDSVLFYRDGNFISSIGRSDVLAQALQRTTWGQGNTGATADANWNTYRFETGNAVIPEASWAAPALGLVAATFVLLRRRRRA